MGSGREIRSYDYVNHSYEDVRKALSTDVLTVFRQATKAATAHAESAASALRVNIAGIEVGTDIEISVKSIESRPAQVSSSPLTVLDLEWEAAQSPRLFPFMRAKLSVYPLSGTETQLELSGNYEPPLGLLGGGIDAVVGHRIAEASVHRFVSDVAKYLRAKLEG